MNINATLFGEFVIGFALLVGVVSYYLGRRKTETPLLAALFGAILALIPPCGLVYLVALLLKKDLDPCAETQHS